MYRVRVPMSSDMPEGRRAEPQEPDGALEQEMSMLDWEVRRNSHVVRTGPVDGCGSTPEKFGKDCDAIRA